jgi:hypothetical protein
VVTLRAAPLDQVMVDCNQLHEKIFSNKREDIKYISQEYKIWFCANKVPAHEVLMSVIKQPLILLR